MKTTLLLSIGMACLSAIGKGGVNPGDEDVLRLRIFAFYGSSPSSLTASFPEGNSNAADDLLSEDRSRGEIVGHCFIEIKNISGSYLTVGHLGLTNNACATIGCWPEPMIITTPQTPVPIQDQQHGAIWYGREAYGTGWTTLESYSLSTTISSIGVDALNTYLTTGSNSSYYYTWRTCANVATEIWNNLVPTSALTLSPTFGNLPQFVKEAIGTKTGYSVNASYSAGSTYGYIKWYNGSFVAG